MDSLEEFRSKIAALKRAHELLIFQQDLSFEVAPRDSRFSAALLDLMKREENIVKDASPAQSSVIIAKVDDMLFSETQQFFAKVISQNNKKWDTLRQNLSKEIQALKKKIATRFRQEDISSAAVASVNANVFSNGNEPTPADERDILAEEEERLLVDYYRNWHRYEMFHLQEAFASQMARIDRDWAVHEQTAKKDYDEKRDAITGRLPSNSQDDSQYGDDNGAASSPHSKKWHHPEKQKALIHTAPVFTPSTTTGRNSSTATGKRDRGLASAAAELQRLDREYQESMQHLQRQKAEAKKWLHRQQLRLSAQCEEVRREKAVMADLYESEYQEIRRMSDVVKKGVQALVANNTNQTRTVSGGAPNANTSSKLASQVRDVRQSVDSNNSSNP